MTDPYKSWTEALFSLRARIVGLEEDAARLDALADSASMLHAENEKLKRDRWKAQAINMMVEAQPYPDGDASIFVRRERLDAAESENARLRVALETAEHGLQTLARWYNHIGLASARIYASSYASNARAALSREVKP